MGAGHKQILLDSKTKAWVDEQNRMNKEKTLGYDKSRKAAKDTKHPDPRINIESSTKSLKRGYSDYFRKRHPTTNTCLTGICQAHCRPFS